MSASIARAIHNRGGAVHELIEARDEKRLLRYQKHLARQDLLSWMNSGSCHFPKPAPRCCLRFQPALRTDFDAGDHQSFLCRMDWGPGIGAAHRSAAGSPDPPCAHPENERGQLPAQQWPEEERSGHPLTTIPRPYRQYLKAAFGNWTAAAGCSLWLSPLTTCRMRNLQAGAA